MTLEFVRVAGHRLAVGRTVQIRINGVIVDTLCELQAELANREIFDRRVYEKVVAYEKALQVTASFRRERATKSPHQRRGSQADD